MTVSTTVLESTLPVDSTRTYRHTEHMSGPTLSGPKRACFVSHPVVTVCDSHTHLVYTGLGYMTPSYGYEDYCPQMGTPSETQALGSSTWRDLIQHVINDLL